ncbi:VanW family protein [Butyrivibrio sp. MC2013]|uniref:VanW family protein n=1 Tax=Butyrivibrio sp. MC2013 TaxID=1280686 RepID=UPI00068529FB|nr:VanW family protein [Butyrivibrio sp. MC2013]
MKKFLGGIIIGLGLMVLPGPAAHAAAGNLISGGVSIGDVDVSGMTPEQARAAVEAKMEEYSQAMITLTGKGENDRYTVSAGDMGLTWTNRSVIDEAARLGKSGNVVKRYKDQKDAEKEGVHFDLEYALDDTILTDIFEKECSSFNSEALNYELHRENGSFVITDGHEGYEIDESGSLETIQNYFADSFRGQDAEIGLQIAVTEPHGSRASLEEVRDVLGSFTTNYRTSGQSRCINIANGCKLAQDKTLYPGDEFNMLENITPFTEANGYALAGSYLNGQVVESFGGGICQVSTTLYNAVLLSELEVTERHNHSMIISYVDPSMDAAIAENGGKNFRFVNNTEYPIYIEGVTEGKNITFTIYGKETRDPGRKVTYTSETLEVTNPETVTFQMNPGLAVGVVSRVQSVHTGIKAQLRKQVTENGSEVVNEVINSSNYKMVPAIYAIGTAGADANIQFSLDAAAATGSLEHVNAVAAQMGAIMAAGQTIDPNTGGVLPAGTPVALPGEGGEAAPAETAVEAPADQGAEAPVEAPVETPVEAPAEEAAP